MFDLVTPLNDIASLRLDANYALDYKDLQEVQYTLDEIQEICDESLTEINRLALLATTGKETKIWIIVSFQNLLFTIKNQ